MVQINLATVYVYSAVPCEIIAKVCLRLRLEGEPITFCGRRGSGIEVDFDRLQGHPDHPWGLKMLFRNCLIESGDSRRQPWESGAVELRAVSHAEIEGPRFADLSILQLT